jgi:hypothetical protein
MDASFDVDAIMREISVVFGLDDSGVESGRPADATSENFLWQILLEFGLGEALAIGGAETTGEDVTLSLDSLLGEEIAIASVVLPPPSLTPAQEQELKAQVAKKQMCEEAQEHFARTLRKAEGAYESLMHIISFWLPRIPSQLVNEDTIAAIQTVQNFFEVPPQNEEQIVALDRCLWSLSQHFGEDQQGLINASRIAWWAHRNLAFQAWQFVNEVCQ